MFNIFSNNTYVCIYILFIGGPFSWRGDPSHEQNVAEEHGQFVIPQHR